MESNSSFVCAWCGGEDMPGAVGSVLVLTAGYGSLNDLERVKVPLCGECCDKLLRELVQLPGAMWEQLEVL